MKNIFIWVGLILMVGMFSGCRVKPPQVVASFEVFHDTVERVRDTVIFMPADSAWLTALLECDSLGQIRVKEIRDYYAGLHVAPPYVRVDGNVLTAGVRVDSVAVFLKLKDRYYRASETKYLEKQVRVNFITGWQNFQMWVGRILLGLGVLYGVVKLVGLYFLGGAGVGSGILGWFKK